MNKTETTKQEIIKIFIDKFVPWRTEVRNQYGGINKITPWGEEQILEVVKWLESALDRIVQVKEEEMVDLVSTDDGNIPKDILNKWIRTKVKSLSHA